MAVKSFLICNVDKILSEDYQAPIQLNLIENEGDQEVSFKSINHCFIKDYSQFLCKYDYTHKVHGKVFNRTFTKYFEPLEFYSYMNKEENVLFIQTRTESAISFINELNQDAHFSMSPIPINFKQMIPYIPEVAGAWVANLKRAHLKTAGLFGPNVHKSDEYKIAAQEGNVSSIMMKYISDKNKQEHTVTISQKGSIVLYDSFKNIEEELELVDEIFHKLIKPHAN